MQSLLAKDDVGLNQTKKKKKRKKQEMIMHRATCQIVDDQDGGRGVKKCTIN